VAKLPNTTARMSFANTLHQTRITQPVLHGGAKRAYHTADNLLSPYLPEYVIDECSRLLMSFSYVLTSAFDAVRLRMLNAILQQQQYCKTEFGQRSGADISV